MDDPFNAVVTLVVVGLLVAEMAYALRCVQWMRAHYGKRLMKSRVWDHMLADDLRISIACVILLFLFIYGLVLWVLNLPPLLPRPTGSVLIGVALGLVLYGPIARRRMLESIVDDADDET